MRNQTELFLTLFLACAIAVATIVSVGIVLQISLWITRDPALISLYLVVRPILLGYVVPFGVFLLALYTIWQGIETFKMLSPRHR